MDIRDILLSLFSGVMYYNNCSITSRFEALVATMCFTIIVYALIIEFQKQWDRLMRKKIKDEKNKIN